MKGNYDFIIQNKYSMYGENYGELYLFLAVETGRLFTFYDS